MKVIPDQNARHKDVLYFNEGQQESVPEARCYLEWKHGLSESVSKYFSVNLGASSSDKGIEDTSNDTVDEGAEDVSSDDTEAPTMQQDLHGWKKFRTPAWATRQRSYNKTECTEEMVWDHLWHSNYTVV